MWNGYLIQIGGGGCQEMLVPIYEKKQNFIMTKTKSLLVKHMLIKYTQTQHVYIKNNLHLR